MNKVNHAALTIGIADADITPPIGVANRCWGAARHAVASGIHQPVARLRLGYSSAADVRAGRYGR